MCCLCFFENADSKSIKGTLFLNSSGRGRPPEEALGEWRGGRADRVDDAGGLAKKRPALWMPNQSAKALTLASKKINKTSNSKFEFSLLTGRGRSGADPGAQLWRDSRGCSRCRFWFDEAEGGFVFLSSFESLFACLVLACRLLAACLPPACRLAAVFLVFTFRRSLNS